MTNFESEFFQKINFTAEQIKRYREAAIADLNIAKKSDVPEVVFEFTYKAFIRLSIAIIAKKGFKVRSSHGHHFKVIEKLSEILNNEDILTIGNKIRQMRNFNFYDEGTFVSEKDAKECLNFVNSLFNQS